MSGRVWKCIKCKATSDLATLVPEMTAKKGSPLTDSEVGELLLGKWHTCNEPLDFEQDQQVRRAKTEYDWRSR